MGTNGVVPEKISKCAEMMNSVRMDGKWQKTYYERLDQCLTDSEEIIDKKLAHLHATIEEWACNVAAGDSVNRILDDRFVGPANADIGSLLEHPEAIQQIYKDTFNALMAERDRFANDPICGKNSQTLNIFSEATRTLVLLRHNLDVKKMNYWELMADDRVDSVDVKFVNDSFSFKYVSNSAVAVAGTLYLGHYVGRLVGIVTSVAPNFFPVVGCICAAVDTVPNLIKWLAPPSDLPTYSR